MAPPLGEDEEPSLGTGRVSARPGWEGVNNARRGTTASPGLSTLLHLEDVRTIRMCSIGLGAHLGALRAGG